jgi:hypothetical protein
MGSSIHKAMLKRDIRALILASILVTGCSLLSPDRQTNSEKESRTGCLAPDAPFHCAANSLYALCAEYDIPASLQLCIELLPPRRGGNSMLEFKNALLSLGFNVEARKIDVGELGWKSACKRDPLRRRIWTHLRPTIHHSMAPSRALFLL